MPSLRERAAFGAQSATLRGASFADDHGLHAEGDAPPSMVVPRRSEESLRLVGIHVLVVEDEPDARELVGELLESRGAEVELAASAAEAYESLDRHVPDVIVSDVGMPGEDGYQFVRRLRELPAGAGGATPVVALTAYTSAQDRRRCSEAGYDCHLSKPVDADELVRVLERLSKPVLPM